MFRIVREAFRRRACMRRVFAKWRQQIFGALKVVFPIGVLLFGASVTRAMEVTLVGNTVVLSGPVAGDDLAKVKDAFAKAPAIDVVVLRNSWGGDAWTGYQVGELFREKGVTTAVSGYCVSSCSRMFLGGRQRLFTDDYPALQTFVGFHGHYDSLGKLDLRSVNEHGLYRWIIKYSDGKADEALVKRWISIDKNKGAANFLHPDVSASRKASVFLCSGDEGNRPLGCEPLASNAMDQGVITDLRRISSPDQAALAHRLRAHQNPASGYGDIDDVSKVPLDLVDGLNNYKRFLESSFPRAFAVSATRRHWAWNAGANDVSEALRRCAERAGEACKLYAVDETVVYRP
ncbi:hypothetical protein [Acidovorax sp. HMWF029]|uniref:hypothetical protein n=1 Tax=Acidovorax sp. HMWF029 TaxID=2056863 RepID=UPI0011B1DA3E|nr:hypothetical protein [Acidovorax sp. HMWF029]